MKKPAAFFEGDSTVSFGPTGRSRHRLLVVFEMLVGVMKACSPKLREYGFIPRLGEGVEGASAGASDAHALVTVRDDSLDGERLGKRPPAPFTRWPWVSG